MSSHRPQSSYSAEEWSRLRLNERLEIRRRDRELGLVSAVAATNPRQDEPAAPNDRGVGFPPQHAPSTAHPPSNTTSPPPPPALASATAEKRPKKTCAICCDEKVPSDFPERISARCKHAGQNFCSDCVAKSIEADVNSKGGNNPVCPEPKCRAALEHDEVKALADGDVFGHYDKLLLRRTLQKLPDFRWCKGNQCGSGHEHAGGSDNPIMTCTACGVKSCFVHDVPWHSGQSCDQYDKSVASDPHTLANLEYAKRHTKKCPRCSKSIEKAGGCDHMTCRRNAGGCGHEFCWRCLADYEMIMRDGNHHHQPTCSFYAPPPRQQGRLADVLARNSRNNRRGRR